jgi:hypothetical protein
LSPGQQVGLRRSISHDVRLACAPRESVWSWNLSARRIGRRLIRLPIAAWIHPQHGVVVEIPLLYPAVLEEDLAVQSGGETENDPTLHLRHDLVRRIVLSNHLPWRCLPQEGCLNWPLPGLPALSTSSRLLAPDLPDTTTPP